MKLVTVTTNAEALTYLVMQLHLIQTNVQAQDTQDLRGSPNTNTELFSL